MSIRIKPENYSAYAIIQLLADQLGAPSRKDYLEHCLSFQVEGGKGKVSGFRFKGGLDMLLLDAKLAESFRMVLPAGATCPLMLSFCVEGSLHHQLEDGERAFDLVAMQSSISANSFFKHEEILLTESPRHVVVLLFIDRKKFLQRKDGRRKEIASRLSEAFKDVKGRDPFYYKTNYNLATSDILQEIMDDRNRGLVRSTLMEGLALQLISYQIVQFQTNLENPQRALVLREEELDLIFRAKSLLLEQMHDPPTISELAFQLGINQTKLKNNFKKVFGIPVKTWFAEKRFEKARFFLINDYLSVEEVARKVGYSNFSYFSRKFRERYGLPPKKYLQHLHEDLGVYDKNLSF